MQITISSKLIVGLIVYVLISSAVLAIVVYIREKANGPLRGDDFSTVLTLAFGWPVSVPIAVGFIVGSVPRILRDRKVNAEQEDRPSSL